MKGLSIVLYVAAGLLTIVGLVMDVTNGDVYNSGLLAARSVVFTMDAACLVSGTVAIAAASIVQACQTNGAERPLGSAVVAPREDSPAMRRTVASNAPVETAPPGVGTVWQPYRAGSAVKRTGASLELARIAAEKGWSIHEYLSHDAAEIANGTEVKTIFTHAEAQALETAQPQKENVA